MEERCVVLVRADANGVGVVWGWWGGGMVWCWGGGGYIWGGVGSNFRNATTRAEDHTKMGSENLYVVRADAMGSENPYVRADAKTEA